MPVKNSTILGQIYLTGSNDYQQRVPNPDQSTIAQQQEFLFDPMNRKYLNEFVDALINRVGRTIVLGKRWDNKLAAFKGANLNFGSTIQEIAPKWIKAHSYADDAETLLKAHRPEAQAWYHSIDRQDVYPISVNEIELRRAFVDDGEYGLNGFIAKVMDVPYNSDSYDEYLIMKNLIAEYGNRWGFFQHQLSAAPTDEATAKELLKAARTYAGRLQFPSSLYNAAKLEDIPVFAAEDELILITTPEVEASIDVDALAALFNIDKAELKFRTVLIDEFPILNGVALLTTRDWFVCHDTYYGTASFFNPQTLTTNYYLHHQGIYSCSPFVPAILFTTDAATVPETTTVDVTAFTLTAEGGTDITADTREVQLAAALTGTVTGRSDIVTVQPKTGITYEVAVKDAEKTVETYVDRFNVLHIQDGLEAGDAVTVTAASSYRNPSGATAVLTASVTLTVA